MKFYKNFTDAFAFIAAFIAFVYVFLAFLKFEPTEDELDQVMHFYDQPSTKIYIKLFIMFIVTGILGLATRKIPGIALSASILCLWFSTRFHLLDQIPKKGLIFMTCAIISIAGNIILSVEFFRKKSIN